MPSLLDRIERKQPTGPLKPKLEPVAPERNGQREPTIPGTPGVSSASAPSLAEGEATPAALLVTPPSPAETQEEIEWRAMRRAIVEQILSGIPSPELLTPKPEIVQMLRERTLAQLEAHGKIFAAPQLEQFQEQVISEIVGYGPLDPLIADVSVNEIMANGPYTVFVERKGKLEETKVHFNDEAHMLRIVDRIIRPLGRHVDRKTPMVDARLPNGSRVNVIIPPSALDGPTITIRKFSRHRLSIDDLIGFGSVTPQMSEFLRACVQSRLNIVISGGTGSGKTTLLNVLSNHILESERIVTIEDSAELQLNKRHVVRLEAKPAEPDGTGRVAIRDLVINSLRMRPDRIIVGECRSAEALDMLQAMNTGHDGSMTTVHANSPRDVLSRLETMTLMAGFDLPIKVIRQQIAAAIDLIVHQERLRDGSRKIVSITEVQGMEGDIIVTQDIFKFVEEGMDSNGRVMGEMLPTGIRPKFTPRLIVAGFDLPPEVFGAFASGTTPRGNTPYGTTRR